MGLRESVERHVGIRAGSQGWTDAQIVTDLTLLQLAGGECVDDLRILEGDEGFCRVRRRVDLHGMGRTERRRHERRWRKERRRTVASPSAAFRYLEGFHDEEEESRREAGKAFIPKPTAGLMGLRRVNAEVLGFVQSRRPSKQATLDVDATLIESHKEQALWCYKGYRAYQPLTVYWAEQRLVAHSEFRDGNVGAGQEIRRVIEEALGYLPSGVEEVRVRSDSAAYQWELLRYLAEGKNERFGRIEFSISADVSDAFREAVRGVPEEEWMSLGERTGQEWAEVCFVPQGTGFRKDGPRYRFVAIRERLKQQASLPGLEAQMDLPFPTMEFSGKGLYKLTAMVTNRDLAGADLIAWHRERCGASEQAHSVMKEDLAGGRLPSKRFGANAAWWAISVLAFNLHEGMKRLVLGGSWVSRRLKAVRFGLICVAGRVLERARQLTVRLSGHHPHTPVLMAARASIAALGGTG
jgi:hypothetical protein